MFTIEFTIIFQNMFRLSDITPAADPMKAGETGESFMEAYEAVLSNMYVRDYNERSSVKYDEAIEFLSAQISHPFEMNKTVARFEMYKTMQERYF